MAEPVAQSIPGVSNAIKSSPVKRKRGRPKTISNDSDDEWFSGPSSSTASTVLPSASTSQKTLAALLGLPGVSSVPTTMDLFNGGNASAIAAALSSINRPDTTSNTSNSSNGNNNNNNGNRLQSVFGQLQGAFTATVSRDYEKAVKIVREVVKTDHPFGADELELIDHVFACVLNTAHYDESMIDVCWEWINCIEREPRCMDARAISSSQLSVYYAYHTISRVQERMPKRADYAETRQSTWNKANKSFKYFWAVGGVVWRAFELDRIDILVNWTYLALQYADAVEDETIKILENHAESTRVVLEKSIVIEHAHQTNERFATVDRNLKEIGTARVEKIRRRTNGVPAVVQSATFPSVSSTTSSSSTSTSTSSKKTLAGALDAIVSRQREAIDQMIKQEEIDTYDDEEL